MSEEIKHHPADTNGDGTVSQEEFNQIRDILQGDQPMSKKVISISDILNKGN